MLLAVTALSSVLTLPALANAEPFQSWLENVKQDARARGIRQEVLEHAFKGVEPDPKIIALDRKQPEVSMTFREYQKRVVSDQRIKEGRELYRKHRAVLERIGREFGVQPRFIVALWGIETSYGKITGNYHVVGALATLAYDGRRSEFFRDELMQALEILNIGDVTPDRMIGSWAGAMGQSQFMPSSFKQFAHDYNGDGRRDIWNTTEDVFASIANYLAKSGWNDDLTWGRVVKVPANFDKSLQGREVRKTVQEWQALGVRNPDGSHLPDKPLTASIVIPEGSHSAYMVYDNYNVIMKWNRSIYFATSVGILSDKIAAGG